MKTRNKINEIGYGIRPHIKLEDKEQEVDKTISTSALVVSGLVFGFILILFVKEIGR